MQTERFSARLGRGVSIAEDVAYGALVESVLEFVVRAAIAKASDQCSWEEEEVRREGLDAIEFLKDGKALWWDSEAFEAERSEAKRERALERFLAENEFGGDFFDTLDSDVRERLRGAGYSTASLRNNLRDTFREIAADASERSAQAREALLAEILGTAGKNPTRAF